MPDKHIPEMIPAFAPEAGGRVASQASPAVGWCRITRNAVVSAEGRQRLHIRRRRAPRNTVAKSSMEPSKSHIECQSEVLKSTVPLEDYSRFHGMLIGPSAARQCIDSINGHVLFMPSTYRRTPEAFPSDGSSLSPWDCRRTLNLITYYLLVLWSITGLSTLLGATRTVDARERTVIGGSEDRKQAGGEHVEVFGAEDLTGTSNQNLDVDPLVLRYLAKPLKGWPQAPASSLRLVRRFEYNFKAAGWEVIMLHFVSLNEAGKIIEDADGRQILHLVEVYEAGWVFHAWIAAAAALLLRLLIAILAHV